MLEDMLTPGELKENDRLKKLLFEFIKSGEAILMAGAGCSGSLYPSWKTLIKELDKEARNYNPKFIGKETDFLKFADEAKNCLGKDRYHSFLYRTFKPGSRTHDKAHEILCRLPFKGITTTNYDIVLESAKNSIQPFSDYSLCFEGTTKTQIHEFLMSLNQNGDSQRRVMHWHGIFKNADSIILSETEYTDKYGFSTQENSDTIYDIVKTAPTQEEFTKALEKYGYTWPLRRKILWSILATRQVFFLGFSLNDPYFLKMLDFLKDDLATYYSKSHFLALRITKSSYGSAVIFAKRYFEDYGIQTVFFFDDEADYSGITNFIYELDAITKSEEIPSKLIEDNPSSTKMNITARNTLLKIGRKQISDGN